MSTIDRWATPLRYPTFERQDGSGGNSSPPAGLPQNVAAIAPGSQNLFNCQRGKLSIDPVIGVDSELDWIRPQEWCRRREHFNLRSLDVDLGQVRRAITRTRISQRERLNGMDTA